MVAEHPVSSPSGSQPELDGEVVGGLKAQRDTEKVVSRSLEVGGGSEGERSRARSGRGQAEV